MFLGARTLVSLWYQGIGEVGFLRECTRHVYTFFSIYTKYTLTKYGFWSDSQNIHLQNTDFEVIHKRNKYYLISIFLTKCWGGTLIRYQSHPLSRLPFHAFNVVLVSCGHFRSYFGQNVISSLSMPMVSNRPYSFLVIVFMPEVIGRRGCWRGTRKTIISFSFGHIIKQWTDW